MRFFGKNKTLQKLFFKGESFEYRDKLNEAENIGRVLECIDRLSPEDRNLDQDEAVYPSKECIDNAKRFIFNFASEIYSKNLKWIEPYVSNEDGDSILIEWYAVNRQLYLEITDSDIEFTAFPTGKAKSEMREGKINDKNRILEWKWLIDEEKTIG